MTDPLPTLLYGNKIVVGNRKSRNELNATGMEYLRNVGTKT